MVWDVAAHRRRDRPGTPRAAAPGRCHPTARLATAHAWAVGPRPTSTTGVPPVPGAPALPASPGTSVRRPAAVATGWPPARAGVQQASSAATAVALARRQCLAALQSWMHCLALVLDSARGTAPQSGSPTSSSASSSTGVLQVSQQYHICRRRWRSAGTRHHHRRRRRFMLVSHYCPQLHLAAHRICCRKSSEGWAKRLSSKLRYHCACSKIAMLPTTKPTAQLQHLRTTAVHPAVWA